MNLNLNVLYMVLLPLMISGRSHEVRFRFLLMSKCEQCLRNDFVQVKGLEALPIAHSLPIIDWSTYDSVTVWSIDMKPLQMSAASSGDKQHFSSVRDAIQSIVRSKGESGDGSESTTTVRGWIWANRGYLELSSGWNVVSLFTGLLMRGSLGFSILHCC